MNKRVQIWNWNLTADYETLMQFLRWFSAAFVSIRTLTTLMMSPRQAGLSHGLSWRIFCSSWLLIIFTSASKQKIGRKQAEIWFLVEDLSQQMLAPPHVLWEVSIGFWVPWSISSWQENYKSVFFPELQFLNDKLQLYPKKLFGTLAKLVWSIYQSKLSILKI